MPTQEIIIASGDAWRFPFDRHTAAERRAPPANGSGPEDSAMNEPDAALAADGDEPDEAVEADLPAFEEEAAVTTAGAGPAEDHAALAMLVRRVMRQDEVALGELYRCLSTRVFRQVSRLVHDIGGAEEVVEDVFWQVWRQAPRFDAERGTVIAWVMQMARSRALDALRASGRNPLFAALDVDEIAHMPTDDDADPQARHERSRVGEQVQKALALLDPLRRQLISLAYERGYSQTEIAEQMNLPLGTVKSHLRRALATMKTTLGAAPERPA